MKFILSKTKRLPSSFKLFDAFTLVELLVVVAIISVLTSVSVATLDYFGKRERVNNIALAMYSWLNEVRQASLRLQGAGCTLNISSGIQNANSVVIQSSPAACRELLQEKDFVFDSYYSQGRSLDVSTSASSIVFTPRSLTTNNSDLIIGLVIGSAAPQRCVKIAKASGLIEIGGNSSSASSSGACEYSLDKTL